MWGARSGNRYPAFSPLPRIERCNISRVPPPGTCNSGAHIFSDPPSLVSWERVVRRQFDCGVAKSVAPCLAQQHQKCWNIEFESRKGGHMTESDVLKREGQILTGVAEKIGATLGSVAAGAETMSKRLATAATEAGKAYRDTMRGKAPRKRHRATTTTRAKRAVRRASSKVKHAALKTRAAARRSVRAGKAAASKVRRAARSKSARRSRPRR